MKLQNCMGSGSQYRKRKSFSVQLVVFSRVQRKNASLNAAQAAVVVRKSQLQLLLSLLLRRCVAVLFKTSNSKKLFISSIVIFMYGNGTQGGDS